MRSLKPSSSSSSSPPQLSFQQIFFVLKTSISSPTSSPSLSGKRRLNTSSSVVFCLCSYYVVFVAHFAIVKADVPLNIFRRSSVSPIISNEMINEVIKQWSPIIWLAPGEKFYPLDIEAFLNNVYASSTPGVAGKENYDGLPEGKLSESLYLHPRQNLDELRNDSTTFIYGRNPMKGPVAVYVTVTKCDKTASRTFSFGKKGFQKEDVSNHIGTSYDDDDYVEQPDVESEILFHISYWFFYPFNEGKEICILGNIPTPLLFNTCFGERRLFGNHVGDFEHISLSFKTPEHPDELFLSVHEGGVYYKFNPPKRVFTYKRQVSAKGLQRPNYPKTVQLMSGRPVLFAAQGSHGLWSTPGQKYYVKLLRLFDSLGYGSPWKTWQHIIVYHEGAEPTWMRYRGRWGSPKTKCIFSQRLGICELTDGPKGILHRNQDFYCFKS